MHQQITEHIKARQKNTQAPVIAPALQRPATLDVLDDILTLNKEINITDCAICKALSVTRPGEHIVTLGDLESMEVIDFRCCDDHLDIIRYSHSPITWDNGSKHGNEYEIGHG